MKNWKYYNKTDEVCDAVINAAYGDASFIKKIRVLMLRKKHPEIEKLYQEYRSSAMEIKKLPVNECPNYILDKVNKKTLGNNINRESFWVDLYSLYIYKPLFSLAVVVLLIGGIIFSILTGPQNIKYSQEEIEFANKQAKETLLVVSKIFNRTTATVTGNILPGRVAVPINKGVKIIEDLFKENKNETIN